MENFIKGIPDTKILGKSVSPVDGRDYRYQVLHKDHILSLEFGLNDVWLIHPTLDLKCCIVRSNTEITQQKFMIIDSYLGRVTHYDQFFTPLTSLGWASQHIFPAHFKFICNFILKNAPNKKWIYM
jgi:hypothetical protein